MIEDTRALIIYIITSETGLIIGFFVLFISSFFLPFKVRLHVLSGGLSLYFYQLFKNYYFRKSEMALRDDYESLDILIKQMNSLHERLLDEFHLAGSNIEELEAEAKHLSHNIEAPRGEDSHMPNFGSQLHEISKNSHPLTKKQRALISLAKKTGTTATLLNSLKHDLDFLQND